MEFLGQLFPPRWGCAAAPRVRCFPLWIIHVLPLSKHSHRTEMHECPSANTSVTSVVAQVIPRHLLQCTYCSARHHPCLSTRRWLSSRSSTRHEHSMLHPNEWRPKRELRNDVIWKIGAGGIRHEPRHAPGFSLIPPMIVFSCSAGNNTTATLGYSGQWPSERCGQTSTYPHRGLLRTLSVAPARSCASLQIG